MTKLHTILKPFVLRRIKSEVEIEIPPKQEMILYAPMTSKSLIPTACVPLSLV